VRAKTEELSALLPNASGAASLSASIEQELWNKWVMLAAGAAVTCLMRGSIGDILQQRDGQAIVREALSECRAVAASSGFELDGQAVEFIEARLLDPGSSWAASMMRDIASGASRIEADAIVGDMLRRAMGFGHVPNILRTAYCQLQVYERQHLT
jgi:2-dehydropantoate 2-reductase